MLQSRSDGSAHADFDKVLAKEPGAENGVVVATPSHARTHRQVRKCALNAAKSISLGSAPCRATTWPMCAAARKYRTAVSAL
jgi:hypothetical protein